LQIPNLTGKDYSVILNKINEISDASKKADENAIKSGSLLKYIVELYDKNGMLNEVKSFYTEAYIYPIEVCYDMGLTNLKHKIRGPFPLIENALADSKINRWELEKDNFTKDKTVIESHIINSRDKNYKYAYVVYEEIFGINKFIEIRFSYKSLSKDSINNILNIKRFGNKRTIEKINIENLKNEDSYFG